MPFNPFEDPFQAGPSSSQDIFRKSRGQIGGIDSRPPRRDAEASESESVNSSPLEEIPREAKQAKAVLRNPKWESAEVGFNEDADVSVEAELPEEHAHKTRVAFELFAKTPDGPERISRAEGSIKDGKALARIPVYFPQYRDAEGNLLPKVEYFFTAKHSASDLLKDENASKEVDRLAERLIEVHVLENVTFETDRSAPRPSQAGAWKSLAAAVKAWREKHPEGKLAAFGHADAVGKEDPNKALSERRARAVHGFLVKEPGSWEALRGEEKWSLATTQELLQFLGHDPGAIDGQDGPKTQAAVKAFQAGKGLKEDGVAGPQTREALYLAFMEDCQAPALKAKDFDAIDGKPSAGCSEFNLLEKTEGACETNRRVAVLLLKSNVNFPIQYPCKHGDIGPCRKQAGRKGERRTPGFQCLFYDQLVKEKKGGGGSQVAPGKLKLVGVKDGDEVKQYVNLEAGAAGEGPDRILEVEVEGASDGAKVFWKVTADKGNSRRTSPKAGLKADAKGTLAELESGVAELETAVKGGKASCVLACGLAGGDRFKVEAGLEKGKAAATLTVAAWRKVYYEIMAPDFMPFEERAETDGSKVKDFPAGMLKRLEERAGKVFVEYKLYKSHLFAEAEAPDSSVFTKDQMLLKSGTQAYMLTDHTFKSYPKKFDKGMSPRSIGLKLCNRNFYYESFDPNLMDNVVQMVDKTMQMKVWDWYKAYYLPRSAENGQDSMKILTWTAKIDPTRHPKHPAVSGGRARSGKLPLTCVTFTNFKEFGIELPSTLPDDPGNLVGASVTSDKCPIEVRMQFESPKAGLGLAGQGAQTGENLVVYNSDAPECFVDVLLHELGHSMGQTVIGSKKAPKGLHMPKTVDEVDAKYAANGTMGHVYTGHKHSGPHCAFGLTDTQKAFGSYRGQGGTCIMFGENSGSDPSSAITGFCPQCADYIRARDLRDLTAVLE